MTIHELAPGEIFETGYELAGDRYVEFAIDQLEGDLLVRLFDATGGELGRSDLPGRPSLTERIAAAVETAGSYSLRIELAAGAPERARFAIHRLVDRPATGRDARRVEAIGLFQDGLRVSDENVEASSREAIDLLGRSGRLFGDIGDAAWQGRARAELGGAYRGVGEVEKARASLSFAVDLLRATRDRRTLAGALTRLGDLLGSLGEVRLGIQHCEEALALARSMRALDLEASSLNSLGVLRFRLGKMDEVVGSFERVVTLGRELGDRERLATNLSNLGAAYRAVGRSEKALGAYREALRFANELGLVSVAVGVFNNLGVLHMARGEIQLAIDAYAEARRLAEHSGDLDSMLHAGFNEGLLYRALGEPLRAWSLLEKALALSRQLGSPTEGRVLQALGEVAADGGDHLRALEFLQEARVQSQAVGDRSGEAYALYGIGRCRLEMGNLGLAGTAFEAARSLQVELSDRRGLASTLRHLSMVAVKENEDARARFLVEEALALAEEIGDPSQEASAREEFAAMLESAGDLMRAKVELERAIGIVESLRGDLVSMDLRATFFARSHERYVRLVSLLRRLEPGSDWVAKAFAVSERARARSLAERLYESRDRQSNKVNPQLERSRRELRAGLSSSQVRLTRLLQRDGTDATEIETARGQVTGAYRALQELEIEIRRSDPRWAAMSYPAPATAATARSLLDDDTALLSYLLGVEESFLFVVTAKSIDALVLPGESELLPLLRDVRESIETPGRRSLSRFSRASRRLYSLLVAPAEEVIGGYRHLIVVPDGGLHYLPFETLLTRKLGAGVAAAPADAYLIARWGLSYVPSVSVLASLKQRQPEVSESRPEWVAFADPAISGAVVGERGETVVRGLGEQGKWQWRRLAGARSEVEHIAKLFAQDDRLVFTGDRANEERFKSEKSVEQTRYLHFASHALLDSAKPSLSAVLLAPGEHGVEDGLLQVHEILDLQLSAELVVLSGCETALGREVRGEGLVGLTQAFLFAGAEAVSVSLWPVEDDSTSELMLRFYSGLQRGESSVEALRSAKLEQLASIATAHPYYWAPFILTGDAG